MHVCMRAQPTCADEDDVGLERPNGRSDGAVKRCQRVGRAGLRRQRHVHRETLALPCM